jgi:hypothetical protein
MHPLVDNLSELTDKELAEKMQKVMRVMQGGSRNGGLYQQAFMIYQNYIAEQQRRQQELLEELDKKSGHNFDDIIDIS